MQDYEERVEEIKKRNQGYLDAFTNYLKENQFSEKTIKNHLRFLDLYLNGYLAEYDKEMKDGCYDVNFFLGDFFYRKRFGSTISFIKESIASYKKFYKYMLDSNNIEKKDYEFLKMTIKIQKDEWIEAMEERC